MARLPIHFSNTFDPSLRRRRNNEKVGRSPDATCAERSLLAIFARLLA